MPPITIYLQARNGQYLTTTNGGGQIMMATGTGPGGSERFQLFNASNGFPPPPLNQVYYGDQVYFQQNLDYVRANGGGGGELVANEPFPGDWARFTICHPDDTPGIRRTGGPVLTGELVVLQAYNGQYVAAEGGGGQEVVANRNLIEDVAKFTISIV